jgi:hypothetical protein
MHMSMYARAQNPQRYCTIITSCITIIVAFLFKKESMECDAKLQHMTCCPAAFVPKNMLKSSGGPKAADAIRYAFVFAD